MEISIHDYVGPHPPGDPHLAEATRVAEGKVAALTTLLFDRTDSDRLIAPTARGALLAMSMSTEIVREHAFISAHPLTSACQSRDGSIIVADASRGIVAVDSAGAVQLLTNSVSLDSSPLNTVVDMDVDGNDNVYFSDNDGVNGRLLRYEPATRQTSVLLHGSGLGRVRLICPSDEQSCCRAPAAQRVAGLPVHNQTQCGARPSGCWPVRCAWTSRTEVR